MPIDFTKVKPQVEKMGRMIAHKTEELSARAQTAYDQFQDLPDNQTIQQRVQLARDKDAGYRGVAPIAINGESIGGRYATPLVPGQATILAVDGSQIYPDIHSSTFYYLTNVAVFTFYHGDDRLPQEFSDPELAYADSLLRDQFDQVISNATVNARRTVREMQSLAQHVWEERHFENPLLAIYDGRLLFWLGKEVPEATLLEDEYRAGIVHLHDTHNWTWNTHGHNTNVVGYVDRPTSRFMIGLLELMALPPVDVTRNKLMSQRFYEGLDDRWLYNRWLRPGERSALMIQQSPQNKFYRQIGENYEIAFFYLNVGRPHLARVEMPMWVAKSPEAVDEVHALLVEQSRIMGNYPYALTRADELAVVRGFDRQALNQMIQHELINNNQIPTASAKLTGKVQTRAGRQRFELDDRARF